MRLPSRVVGKLFSGAMWKVDSKKLEIYEADNDSVICGDDNGTEIKLSVNDLAKRGTFLGDRYSDVD